jgi:hypothetical protein
VDLSRFGRGSPVRLYQDTVTPWILDERVTFGVGGRYGRGLAKSGEMFGIFTGSVSMAQVISGLNPGSVYSVSWYQTMRTGLKMTFLFVSSGKNSLKAVPATVILLLSRQLGLLGFGSLKS